MSPITKKLHFKGSRRSNGCYDADVSPLLQVKLKQAGIRAAVS
jgi:hypothetical protein